MELEKNNLIDGEIMTDINEIEAIAHENLDLAKYQKNLAIDLQRMSKLELDRAKARNNLMKKEIDTAKARLEVAETNRVIVDKKIDHNKSNTLRFSDDELNHEKEYSDYNEKIAKIQIKIAELGQQISEVERDLASTNQELANAKMNLAKVVEKLSKDQFKYVKLCKEGASDQKIENAKKEYENQESLVEEEKKAVMQIHADIRQKENNLTDLKKQQSELLLERDKIRHP